MKIQRTQSFTLFVALAGALALSACGKKEEAAPPPPAPAPAPMPAPTPPPAPVAVPVSVASVDLGTAVGEDKKVSAATTQFGPKDTIYASVATTGTAPTAVISAKWTYQDGQTVNESSQTIAPTGPADTAFHISKPDGWPAGNYKVEVSLDGKPVSSKDFSVK